MIIQKPVIRKYSDHLDNVYLVSEGKKVGLVSIPDRAGSVPDALDADMLRALGGTVVLSPRWEEIRAYICFDPDEFTMAELNHSAGITCNYYVRKDGRWGILDEAGHMIQEPLYDEIFIVDSEILEEYGFRDIGNVPDRIVNMDLVGGCVLVRIGEKWGMLRGRGRTALPVEYDSIIAVPPCVIGMEAFIVRRYGFSGVVNQGGKFLLPLIYPSLDCDGLDYLQFFTVFRIAGETGTGFVRLGDGRCLVAPEWERVDTDRLYLPGDEEPAGHIFTVWKNGHCGLIFDERGIIIPPVWDEIIPRRIHTSEPFSYSVRKGKSWGCYDAKGNQICDAVWDEVGIFLNGIACVRKDGRWGAIGPDGQLRVPAEWDEMEGFGIAAAEYDVLSDTNLGVLLGQHRKAADRLPDCLSWVRRNGLWGLIDTDGTVIAEPVWETHDTTSARKSGSAPMELRIDVNGPVLQRSSDEPRPGGVPEEKSLLTPDGTEIRVVIRKPGSPG